MQKKGYKHTDEARANMRRAALARDNTNRLAAMPKGTYHWKWSGRPSVLALHKRIHRAYGAAKQFPCSKRGCKNQAHDWANMSGKYTDNVKDYKPMCRSCHVKLDKNWIKKK